MCSILILPTVGVFGHMFDSKAFGLGNGIKQNLSHAHNHHMLSRSGRHQISSVLLLT